MKSRLQSRTHFNPLGYAPEKVRRLFLLKKRLALASTGSESPFPKHTLRVVEQSVGMSSNQSLYDHNDPSFLFTKESTVPEGSIASASASSELFVSFEKSSTSCA
uniref:Uncharacterized protein n=1 Tax=mine drainage metagenome TaxID=410659 RepID=E6PPM8_9ZZZZ